MGVTREKDGAGDLGMVTRARKRRMVETSGVRKEVKTSEWIICHNVATKHLVFQMPS